MTARQARLIRRGIMLARAGGGCPGNGLAFEAWLRTCYPNAYLSAQKSLSRLDLLDAPNSPANTNPGTHSRPTPTSAPQTPQKAAQDTLRGKGARDQ